MCGIWLYLGLNSSHAEKEILEQSRKLLPRGPDRNIIKKISFNDFTLYMVFYRLAIMDLSEAGDQPFVMEQNDEQIYPEANVVDQQFKSIGEALNWAVIQYSEYGVDVHPECAESKSMLKRIKAIARGQK